MELHELQLPNNHQRMIDRFVSACQADERVVAPELAKEHHITYQIDLERMMIDRLEKLGAIGL